MDIFERNKIGFHNSFLLAMLVKNVDYDNFEYCKKDELFATLIKRYYYVYAANDFRNRRDECYWIAALAPKLVRKAAYPFLIDIIKG